MNLKRKYLIYFQNRKSAIMRFQDYHEFIKLRNILLSLITI